MRELQALGAVHGHDQRPAGPDLLTVHDLHLQALLAQRGGHLVALALVGHEDGDRLGGRGPGTGLPGRGRLQPLAHDRGDAQYLLVR